MEGASIIMEANHLRLADQPASEAEEGEDEETEEGAEEVDTWALVWQVVDRQVQELAFTLRVERVEAVLLVNLPPDHAVQDRGWWVVLFSIFVLSCISYFSGQNSDTRLLQVWPGEAAGVGAGGAGLGRLRQAQLPVQQGHAPHEGRHPQEGLPAARGEVGEAPHEAAQAARVQVRPCAQHCWQERGSKFRARAK